MPTPPFQLTTLQPVVNRAQQWRVFFANGFQFTFTPVDFSITFQSPVPMGPTGIAQQDEATVQLTLAGMKGLRDHLVKIVDIYEKINGPIKVTKESSPTDAQLASLETLLKNTPLT